MRDKKGRFISTEAFRESSCKTCDKSFLSYASNQRSYCSKKCFDKFQVGKTRSPDVRDRIRFRTARGINHYRWKGGITPEVIKIRHCYKYVEWRKQIFEWDNYKCRICGLKNKNLQADHYPFGFSHLMEVMKIKNLQEALGCNILWDINNGRTLCIECHRSVKKYQKGYGYA